MEGPIALPKWRRLAHSPLCSHPLPRPRGHMPLTRPSRNSQRAGPASSPSGRGDAGMRTRAKAVTAASPTTTRRRSTPVSRTRPSRPQRPRLVVPPPPSPPPPGQPLSSSLALLPRQWAATLLAPSRTILPRWPPLHAPTRRLLGLQSPPLRLRIQGQLARSQAIRPLLRAWLVAPLSWVLSPMTAASKMTTTTTTQKAMPTSLCPWRLCFPPPVALPIRPPTTDKALCPHLCPQLAAAITCGAEAEAAVAATMAREERPDEVGPQRARGIAHDRGASSKRATSLHVSPRPAPTRAAVALAKQRANRRRAASDVPSAERLGSDGARTRSFLHRKWLPPRARQPTHTLPPSAPSPSHRTYVRTEPPCPLYSLPRRSTQVRSHLWRSLPPRTREARNAGGAQAELPAL